MLFESSSEGGGDDGGVGGSEGGGGEGGGGGGVEGGALVSTTVWVSSVTARSPARLRTAVVRVFEIMLTSTLPAWACKALLWTCRAV